MDQDNIINTIQKKSSKIPFRLVWQNVFSTDCKTTIGMYNTMTLIMAVSYFYVQLCLTLHTVISFPVKL
jgi:hypothetical protein